MWYTPWQLFTLYIITYKSVMFGSMRPRIPGTFSTRGSAIIAVENSTTLPTEAYPDEYGTRKTHV